MFYKVFENIELVPLSWRSSERSFIYVFNPAIHKLQDSYLMIYRVVDSENMLRRIASCRLDENFIPIKDSIVPFSDFIEFSPLCKANEHSGNWFADPRIFRINDELFVIWNDNVNYPRSNQFIVKISETSLKPVEAAKKIEWKYHSSSREKNWILFEENGLVYCLYSYNPQLVLKQKLKAKGNINFTYCSEYSWKNLLNDSFDEIRGGTNVVQVGNKYWTLAHVVKSDGGKKEYLSVWVEFAKSFPFSITRSMRSAFSLPNPGNKQFDFPKLNSKVSGVVYPVGLAKDNDSLIISYGINDEHSAIAKVSIKEVEQQLVKVEPENSQKFIFDKKQLKKMLRRLI